MRNFFYLLLIFVLGSVNVSAQCDILQNSLNPSTMEFTVELTTNNGYVLYDDCISDCEQDQYWNGSYGESCEDQCENSICNIDVAMALNYSVFPDVHPLSFSFVATYNSTNEEDYPIKIFYNNPHVFDVNDFTSNQLALWQERWNNPSEHWVCFSFTNTISYCNGEEVFCTQIICNK